MRRALPLLAVRLVAALALPATAPAIGGGAGHNKPTKQLENAFKIALYVRSVSKDGCYPPVHELAATIRRINPHMRVRVVRGLRQVRRRGIVYILKKGS